MKLKAISGVLLLLLLADVCLAKGSKTLLVADRKMACAGSFECIQIKEKASAQWRFYSDTIEGFNYEAGYEYKISVQPLQTKNTLSGLYEEKYKLLHIISKRKTDYNPAEKLGNKKWVLTSIYDTNRKLTIPDTTLVLRFSIKDGKISGKNVCNGFTGSFTLQGDKLTFANITATKMLCKGQELENVIFRFYKKTTAYTLTENTLTLSQPDGSNMVFDGR